MLKPLGTYETRGSASLQLQGGAGGGNSWRSPAGAPAAVEPGEGGGGTGGGKADSRWGKKGGAVAGGGGEGGAGGVHGRQTGEGAGGGGGTRRPMAGLGEEEVANAGEELKVGDARTRRSRDSNGCGQICFVHRTASTCRIVIAPVTCDRDDDRPYVRRERRGTRWKETRPAGRGRGQGQGRAAGAHAPFVRHPPPSRGSR